MARPETVQNVTHGRKNDVPELSVDPWPSGNLVVRAFVELGMVKWDQIEKQSVFGALCKSSGSGKGYFEPKRFGKIALAMAIPA